MPLHTSKPRSGNAAEDMRRDQQKLRSARDNIIRLEAEFESVQKQIDEHEAWFKEEGFTLGDDLADQIAELQDSYEEQLQDLLRKIDAA